MMDIAAYVRDMIAKMTSSGAPVVSAPAGGRPVSEGGPAASSASLGPCPKCGGQVHAGSWNYACQKGCGFSLPKKLAQKDLSESLMNVLLKKKRTQPLKGFVSKAGNKFEAALFLNEAHEVKFVFEDPRSAAKK